MNTPHTSIRIPADIKKRLRLEAAKTGKTQTEIILNAIKNYLK